MVFRVNRIDLTMNGDFSKTPSSNSSISILGDIDIHAITIKDESHSRITNSEISTNFLTGSIDEINERRSLLPVHRSILGVAPLCDRCGDELIFNKHDTLCEDCERALGEELRDREVMNLFFG